MMNKHAILIIAHNNIWTLKEVIKSLDSNYFDIFLHIDIKSNINVNEFEKITTKSNLYVYKKIDVRWGDYSQIECELLLLKSAAKKMDYSYYHLISGVDLPLNSNEKIHSFFEQSGKEFVHFASKILPKYKENYYYHYNFNMKRYKENNFQKIINQSLVIFQKCLRIKINKNINIYAGSNWFSITGNFAKYVIKNQEFIFKTFRYSRSGDEAFIQTLLYNSDYRENIYNNQYNDDYNGCKRLIDWKRGNPYVFKLKDFEELSSTSCLFARKFDENIDKEIIIKVLNHKKDK